MQKAIAVLVVLIVATVTPRAKADIIYDNLASTTYTSSSSWDGILGANWGGPANASTSFVAGTSEDLTDILAAITTAKVPSPLFNLSLTDSSDTVLESWVGLLAPAGRLGPVSVVDVVSVLHPHLTSGNTYTLTASPNNADVFGEWDLDNSLNGGPGFRVLGGQVATPEPTSLTLFATAFFALGGSSALRRRRRGVVESALN